MRSLIIAAGLAITASPSFATIITFEELGPQTGSFSGTSPLSTQYAGVTFSGPSSTQGGAILNQSGNFGIGARSGEHFLAFNRGTYAIDPETISFSSRMSYVEIWAAGGFSTGTFLMVAYDRFNNPLGSDVVSASSSWGQLSIATPGIRSVVLTEVGGAGAFVYDDLDYKPVPSTGPLALLGLGGLAAARRRR